MNTPQYFQDQNSHSISSVEDSFPRSLGYRMPAEWELHRATWIVWPHSWHDWESKLSAVSWCYVEIVRQLLSSERVAILFKNADHELRAKQKLQQAIDDLSNVESHLIQTNRSWIRDSGPIFIVRSCGDRGSMKDAGEVAITDWGFNSWSRYSNWKLDNQIPMRLAEILGMQRFEAYVQVNRKRRHLVLEGGSIDVDGEGLLMTTEECLLDSVQVRNPGVSAELIEKLLCDYLGIQKVLWLKGGIAGDDTHGHIDDVARFVAPGVVVAAIEKNSTDENYEILNENRRRLEKMTDLHGRHLKVIPVPMPKPLYFEGERLPASYLNFYIGNRLVLVPTFNDPADRIAMSLFSDLFPGREIIGIHAVDLVLGLGAIHCITQQEPKHVP